MAYTKQTWADLPSKTTPINATRLTHIEDGIYNAAATADTAASTAGTAAANVGIVSGKVETLTERVNGLDTAVSNKVDKVAGKGLSTNDYDNTDKGKVDSLGTASTKNSTSVVTESSDLVESGAVKDIVGWGNKNLCPTFKGDVINSVTFTVDKDGVITATGTATGGAGGVVSYFTTKKSKMVIVNGCNSGNPKIQIFPYCVDDSARPYTDATKTARLTSNDNVYNGNELPFYIEQDKTYYLGCRVLAGETVNGQKFYPMVRDANITDATYEPYHTSVDKSKADNSVIGTVEGANASKAWSVGEHFIKDGAFKKVTQPISSGGAINDSNTVDKPIADCLVKQEAFTITTNADGLANLTDRNSRIILRIDSANSKICVPYRTTGGTNNIIVFNNDMTVAANLEVSGTYYYI